MAKARRTGKEELETKKTGGIKYRSDTVVESLASEDFYY